MFRYGIQDEDSQWSRENYVFDTGFYHMMAGGWHRHCTNPAPGSPPLVADDGSGNKVCPDGWKTTWLVAQVARLDLYPEDRTIFLNTDLALFQKEPFPNKFKGISSTGTSSQLNGYLADASAWYKDFSAAMAKMTELGHSNLKSVQGLAFPITPAPPPAKVNANVHMFAPPTPYPLATGANGMVCGGDLNHFADLAEMYRYGWSTDSVFDEGSARPLVDPKMRALEEPYCGKPDGSKTFFGWRYNKAIGGVKAFLPGAGSATLTYKNCGKDDKVVVNVDGKDICFADPKPGNSLAPDTCTFDFSN